MACIALHNIRTDRSNHCQPRWRLEVEQLESMEKPLSYAVDKKESNLIKMEVSNWQWMYHEMNIVTSQNLQENTCLRPATLLKKRFLHRFACEFCEVSKNNFLHRTPLVAASVRSN